MLFYREWMLKSYEITDAEFGVVRVRVSARARRLIFRAQKGALEIVLPVNGLPRGVDLCGIIESNRAALRRIVARGKVRAAECALHDGRVICFPEGSIAIKATNDLKRGYLKVYCPEKDRLVVAYNPQDDLSSPENYKKAARCVMRLMGIRFGGVLRTLVETLADKLDAHPAEVRIGRGSRLLGHCSRSGVVTVSVYALFLPEHLRTYLVCHELAHLTYFDHSASFHKLCDEYCGGKGYEWRAELKRFMLPMS